MHRMFDQEAGTYALSNADVRKTQISVLICASYPGNVLNKEETAAISNYAGCHHDGEAPIDEDNNGLLFLNSQIRYHDILDGSSHTLLVGEMFPGPNTLGWASGTRSTR